MYEFVIDTIKALPVIASQDQEFWLAAAISCPDAIVCSSTTAEPSVPCRLLPVDLLQIYDRCIRGYTRLGAIAPPAVVVPALRQVIAEAIEARERIFHFRVSKLFRFLSGAERYEDECVPLAAQIFEIAQCLAVFPCSFLRQWCANLDASNANPSEGVAREAFDSLDCDAIIAAINATALEARKTLVEGYLRYSLRLARNQINSGLEFEDMVQEAALGLVVAAAKFDFLEHRRFALFATTWMWQHIMRSLANDSRVVRLPVHAVQKLRDAQKLLRQQLRVVESAVPVQDLLEYVGLDPDTHMPLFGAGVLPIRIDSPGPMFTRTAVDEFLLSQQQVSNRDEALTYDALLEFIRKTLSRQQADVVESRFGFGADGRELTLEEIGKVYDVTRERIRQVEKKALETLSLGTHKRGLLGFKKAVLGVGLTDGSPHSPTRMPDPITCDEALDPAHPYAADDGGRLDSLLRRAFGSRQTNVRQNVTIKGQLLAVFAANGRAMHTSRVQAILQELYPSEQHLETTLYAAMIGHPDIFLNLGAAVFSSVEVERRSIARGHYQLPFCPCISGDTSLVASGLAAALVAYRELPMTFDLQWAICRIAEAIHGTGDSLEWYRQNLASLFYALGLLPYAELLSSSPIAISKRDAVPDAPAMFFTLIDRVAGMHSFCSLLESLQPASQAALARRFADFYDIGQYDCPNRLSLLVQLGIVERVQGNFSLTPDGWQAIRRVEEERGPGEHPSAAPKLLDMFVAEHVATEEQRVMDELFEQLTGN